MVEKEKSNKKVVVKPSQEARLEIERWFRNEYIERKMRITRYNYLKIPHKDTLYALEMEAYEKEQKLRELKGEELLPDIKIGGIF